MWLTRALVSEDVDPTTRVPALRAIRRALALDSLNAEAWHWSGLTLEEIGEQEGARAAWRRALMLNPGHLEATAFLAFHYWWWRQYDSAAVWADSAVANDPTYLLAHYAAGDVALARGRWSESEAQFLAARRLASGPEIGALTGLTRLASATGDTARAREFLAQAVALTDSLAPAVHSATALGGAYAALGEGEVNRFQALLAEDGPSNP